MEHVEPKRPLWKRAAASLFLFAPWTVATWAIHAWSGLGWVLSVLLGLAVAIVFLMAFAAVFFTVAMAAGSR